MFEFGILAEKVIRYPVEGIMILCCLASMSLFALFSLYLLEDIIKDLRQRQYKSALVGAWIMASCVGIAFVIARITVILTISLLR